MAAARAILEEGVHQLADAIRNSLNFYRMQQNAEKVERAVLTGPAVDIPGFADSLATALGMPVGSISPTRGRCLAKLRALLADETGGAWRDAS